MRMHLSLGDAPICSTTTFCIQMSLGLQANLHGSKTRFLVQCPTQQSLPILAFKLMNNLVSILPNTASCSIIANLKIYHHLNLQDCQPPASLIRFSTPQINIYIYSLTANTIEIPQNQQHGRLPIVSILFIHDDVNLDLIFPANLASGLRPESGISAHQVPPKTTTTAWQWSQIASGWSHFQQNGTILEGILRFLILRQPHISRGCQTSGPHSSDTLQKKKGDSQESCLNFNVLSLDFGARCSGWLFRVSPTKNVSKFGGSGHQICGAQSW